MKLFLAQHGTAVDKSIDPNRPLAPEGITEVEVVAFENAGLICLEQIASGGWEINWIVTPDMLIQTQQASRKGRR